MAIVLRSSGGGIKRSLKMAWFQPGRVVQTCNASMELRKECYKSQESLTQDTAFMRAGYGNRKGKGQTAHLEQVDNGRDLT